jgi:hypothetical protein
LLELGLLEVADGRRAAGLPLLRQSLQMAAGFVDTLSIAWSLIGLAAVAASRGEATAARLLGFVDAQARAMGAEFLQAPFERDFYAGIIAAASEIMSPEELDAERAAGAAMSVEEAVEYALAAVD